MRRLLLVAWLVVLQVQPAFTFAFSPQGRAALDIGHAVLHDAVRGHHHHEGELAVHENHEDGPIAHVHHDATPYGAPLRALPAFAAGSARSMHSSALSPRALAPPYLDGPLRPPRVRA